MEQCQCEVKINGSESAFSIAALAPPVVRVVILWSPVDMKKWRIVTVIRLARASHIRLTCEQSIVVKLQ